MNNYFDELCSIYPAMDELWIKLLAGFLKKNNVLDAFILNCKSQSSWNVDRKSITIPSQIIMYSFDWGLFLCDADRNIPYVDWLSIDNLWRNSLYATGGIYG